MTTFEPALGDQYLWISSSKWDKILNIGSWEANGGNTFGYMSTHEVLNRKIYGEREWVVEESQPQKSNQKIRYQLETS